MEQNLSRLQDVNIEEAKFIGLYNTWASFFHLYNLEEAAEIVPAKDVSTEGESTKDEPTKDKPAEKETAKDKIAGEVHAIKDCAAKAPTEDPTKIHASDNPAEIPAEVPVEVPVEVPAELTSASA